MDFSFTYLLEALKAGAAAIPTTLLIAFIPLILGAGLGLLVALARFFSVRVLGTVLRWLVTIIKGIPVVLILLVLYIAMAGAFDPFMQSLGSDLTFRDTNKAIVAMVAFLIYASTALSEALRGALASVGKGQFEAGYAAGLTRTQLLTRIVLPQALPVSLPMVSNITISLVKAVAIASVVSVIDVMTAAVVSMANSYRFLEAYVAAAIIYWVICVVIERLFSITEKRFNLKMKAA
jgi:L-cystine transport system permease protein